jgi:hypothetical protein
MLLCFTNISAEILQLMLGYKFFTKRHILMNFWQNTVTIKASKIICAKGALLWHLKRW